MDARLLVAVCWRVRPWVTLDELKFAALTQGY
jgi:hypothetical protein